MTPWGNSEELRARLLSPGPGNSPQEVAENQRQRLLGAMVASVAEKGYEDTGVADLSEISGVSPRSFYQQFESKRECFIAALEAVLALAVERTMQPPASPDWREEARNRIVAFASFASEQPAAARLFLVEAYSAGSEPAAMVDRTIVELERLVGRRLADAGLPSAMPSELTVAAVATAIAGVRQRLVDEQVERLPVYADQLATFLLEFEPPARPLRAAVRPPGQRDEEREAGDHAERALRAFEALLSEVPFAEITMGQVAKRAGMSVRTLYANFTDRGALMLAAVDGAATQAVAVMLPAYRRSANPAEGVTAAFSALYGTLASRPRLAHLLLSGVREGGAPALARRTEALRPIEPLLSAGVPAHRRPVSIRIASEALLGAVLGLARRRMEDSGAGALPGLVPISSFMVLAPVLGTEQATAAAEGKTYRKPAPALTENILRARLSPVAEQLLVSLVDGPMTALELHEATLSSAAEVEEQIRKLEAGGVIEAVDPGPSSTATRYELAWARISTEESGELTQAEREAFSLQIGQVTKAEIEEAVEAGTFDAREDRFLARVPMWLDERGWSELTEHLDASLDTSLRIQRDASERLREGGDPGAGSFGRLLLVTFEVPRREG